MDQYQQLDMQTLTQLASDASIKTGITVSVTRNTCINVKAIVPGSAQVRSYLNEQGAAIFIDGLMAGALLHSLASFPSRLAPSLPVDNSPDTYPD